MSQFDWPSLLRAGVRGLGLRPAEFWALTPAELHLLWVVVMRLWGGAGWTP